MDDKTNEVILNTERNENINDHLNMLIFESNKEEHINKEHINEKFELGEKYFFF